MSLWNDIKGWFDKEEPQQKPEQPAGEAAPHNLSTKILFKEILKEAGVKQSHIERYNLIELFDEWYTGEAKKENIRDSIGEFKTKNPAVNAGYIWKSLK
jgi:hypothetical protein